MYAADLELQSSYAQLFSEMPPKSQNLATKTEECLLRSLSEVSGNPCVSESPWSSLIEHAAIAKYASPDTLTHESYDTTKSACLAFPLHSSDDHVKATAVCQHAWPLGLL